VAGEEQYRERLAEMGSEIRGRRESLGLSIDEASDRTRIRAKYLRAVEDGDESTAPGSTYFKAFLKTYSTFLGLDGLRYSLAYQEILDLKAAGPSRERPRGEKSKIEPPAAGRQRPSKEEGAPPAPRPEAQAPEVKGVPILPPTIVRTVKPPTSPPPVRPASLQADAGAGAAARRPARHPRRSPRPVPWAFALFFVVAVAVFIVVNRENAGEVVGPGATPGPPAQSGEGTRPPEPPEPPEPKIVRTDPDKETTLYMIDRTPLELTIKAGKDADSYCWVRVSVDGKMAFEKTLVPGTEEKVSAKSEIVIRAGKPWVISLTLNGKDLGPPGELGPVKEITIRSEAKSQ
jgi:hypothetical protein